MFKSKQILWGIVAVLIIVLAGVWVYTTAQHSSKNSSTNQQNTTTNTKAPTLGNFSFSGEVTDVSGDFLKVNTTSIVNGKTIPTVRTVQILPNTIYVHAKTRTPAKQSEIKKGTNITVDTNLDPATITNVLPSKIEIH